jgi:polyhydroxyalkanoate synthesis regulator phasin
MDDLAKELVKRAGLTEDEAKAAARVVVEWLKHDANRKKIIAAALASAVAARAI